MSKTIMKHGKKPKKSIKYRVSCTCCGCYFQYDEDDILDYYRDLSNTHRVLCPEEFCNQVVIGTKLNIVGYNSIEDHKN